MESKLLLKIITIAFIVLAVVFSLSYAFLAIGGKVFIARQLEKAFHRPVSISYIILTPPFNVEIRGLNIQGLVKVDSIYASPSIFGFLRGRIAFNRIIITKPQITYEYGIPQASKNSQSQDSSVKPQENKPPVTVDIGSIPTVVTNTTKAIDSVVQAVSAITTGNQTTPAPVEQQQKPAVTPPAANTTAPSVQAQPAVKSLPPMIFKRLVIKDGRFDFIDYSVAKDGIRITFKDIQFKLSNLYLLPVSAVANFELHARMPWQEGSAQGRLELAGWLNLYEKDMRATLKIYDIDGIYLYPYYSTWVDLDKARIQKAKLNFTSDIKGIDNDIVSNCHLELTDIVRTPRSPDAPAEKAEKITDAVLDIFRALDQGKIVLDFTIKTKMDRPEFGFANIKMAFENKLAQRRSSAMRPEDLLKAPAKVLEGTVKGAMDLSKAMIDGIFAIGGELTKVTGEKFKQEPKE